MTMTGITPESQLDQAFCEMSATEDNVKKLREKVQRAQEKVEANKGLPEAAQLEKENSLARLRVLQLAKTSSDSQGAKHAELQKNLKAVQNNIDQAEAIGRAKAAVTDAKTSIQALAQKAPDSFQQQLNDLTGPEAKLSKSEGELDKLTLTSQQRGALTRKANALESELTKVKQEEECQPEVTAEEVKQAEDECFAANLAVLQAPELVRDARIKLQALRDELAEAENRNSVAKANRDEVEQLFIEDIDFAGPDTDGFVTATAKLRQDLPPGYSLQWTLNGTPVQADKEGKIRFSTNGQSGASYVLNVTLQKVSTTK